MMRRKRKDNVRRQGRARPVLTGLLALAGAAVMLYPTLSNLYYQHRYAQEAEAFANGQSAVETAALWESAEAYNAVLAEKKDQFVLTQEECEWIESCLNPLGTGMMGTVEIPKIHVDLPIYQGTEEKQLQSGCGWWPGTSLPTGGADTHSVITAHTGLAKAKLFTDLDQMEVGDRFTLHILDRSMTYEVDQILVTEPEELDALRIVPGEDFVTLYTCTPYGINSHRLLVRGQRVGEERAAEADRSMAWWIVPAALAGTAAAVLAGRRRRK